MFKKTVIAFNVGILISCGICLIGALVKEDLGFTALSILAIMGWLEALIFIIEFKE